jgi:S1-C subfamily serine protease
VTAVIAHHGRPASRPLFVAVVLSIVLLAGCVPPAPPLAAAPERDDTPTEELPAPPELAVTSVGRQAQEITVRIRSLGCSQFGIGSGFLLPGGVVVTNRHVIDQPRRVTVDTWDGRQLEADVTGIAIDSDLALLQLEDAADLPVARLRTRAVAVGEPLEVVGFPEGGPLTVTPGEALGMVDGQLLGEPADVLRIDATIAQGNSGGPVLDADAQVVGVVFAREVERGTALAVPVATLVERLDATDLVPPAGC